MYVEGQQLQWPWFNLWRGRWQAPVSSWLTPESESESEVTQSCSTLWTPWTVAHQAPLSMGFSRQEYWSGLPFPSPGDLPNPGIKPRSPALQADTLTSEPPLQGHKYDHDLGPISWSFCPKVLGILILRSGEDFANKILHVVLLD